MAAGEFGTLHDAQLAIAREHGLPSWTALKCRVEGAPRPALAQVKWVIARFAGAGTDGWTAPDDAELRTLQAQLADLRVEAVVAAGPPHRITGLRVYPVGRRVTDERVAAPAPRTIGDVPDLAARLAEESLADLGLVGLTVAGASGGRTWAAARGWADLERTEQLRPDHRFPAYSITKLITATAVLRLVADGRIGLDDPANTHLRTARCTCTATRAAARRPPRP